MGSFFIFVVFFFSFIILMGYIYQTPVELKKVISWFFNKNSNKKIEPSIKIENIPQKQENRFLIDKNTDNKEIKEKNILETKLPPKTQIIDVSENLEIKKENDAIFLDQEILLEDHFNLSNREFRKKYSQDLKIIEISDGFEKGTPIFETSSTGKYIAIKENNEKYLIFYSKGTNITSENHSVVSIFTLDQEIEKDKIYENWKTTKPASFFLHNDNTWSIKEKGIINLDFNEEFVESNIISNIETKKDVDFIIIEEKNDIISDKNQIFDDIKQEILGNKKKDEKLLSDLKKYLPKALDEVNNFSESIFKKRNPEYINLMYDGRLKNNNLKEVKSGNFLAFKSFEFSKITDCEYYFLFTNQKQANSNDYLDLYFNISHKHVLKDKLIDKLLVITKLAIIKFESKTNSSINTYKLIEKGEITIFSLEEKNK